MYGAANQFLEEEVFGNNESLLDSISEPASPNQLPIQVSLADSAAACILDDRVSGHLTITVDS